MTRFDPPSLSSIRDTQNVENDRPTGHVGGQPPSLIPLTPSSAQDVRQLQFLTLAHQRISHVQVDAAHHAFFDRQERLILVEMHGFSVVDATTGTKHMTRQDASSPHAAQRVGDTIVMTRNQRVVAFHEHDNWRTWSVLAGAETPTRVQNIVASRDRALVYLQHHTVVDAVSGTPILSNIQDIYPRYNDQGNVVGWYALDRSGVSIWSDHQGHPAPFIACDTRPLAVHSTPYGLVLCEARGTQTRLRWIQSNGRVAWVRTLSGIAPHVQRKIVMELHHTPSQTAYMGMTVRVHHTWWAFRLHTRTLLPTLVLHHQESLASRIVWAEDGLVVASGERLRVFPLEGRRPEALWEMAVPSRLGCLTPVFPMCVRDGVVAYCTDIVRVCRVRDGHMLSDYQSNWTSVFDIRMTPNYGVTVAAVIPGKSIDLHHGRPQYWLGLVQDIAS